MDIIEIERALIKRYRNKLYNKFVKALIDFQMLEENDVIGVCISGGKDSLLMAKMFQEFERHGPIKITVKYLVMNPGFNQENLDQLIKNAEKLNIPIIIRESNIFQVAERHGGDGPCYLCARMRRGFLYKFAQDEGCNKIALGHHYNDVIETTLLNIFYGGSFKTMMPKLKAENFENMELIRPMYYVEERNIINFMKYIGLEAMNCGCKIARGELSSKRKEMKELIAKIKYNFKDVEKSIFQSANNVNMDCILGWVKEDKKNSFLDKYESK